EGRGMNAVERAGGQQQLARWQRRRGEECALILHCTCSVPAVSDGVVLIGVFEDESAPILATRNEYGTGWEQCCDVRRACTRHRGSGRPAIGYRIVQLGAGDRIVQPVF